MVRSIHDAAKAGDLDEVKRLITEDAALLEARTNSYAYEGYSMPHSTPVMIASAHGYTEIVTWLVGQGANVEAVDGDGRKALWHASCSRHVNIVTVLIERGGANTLGGSDPQSPTALMAAASKGHVDVVGYLMDHGADYTVRCQGDNALYYATMYNQLKVVKVLIEKGMDINGDCTDSGYTALMLTSLWGRVATVEYLCKHPSLGCINARSRHGYTALHYSCGDGRDIQITKILLEAGADPRITDSEGRTPLERALSQNNQGVVPLLEVGEQKQVYLSYWPSASHFHHLSFSHTNTTDCFN